MVLAEDFQRPGSLSRLKTAPRYERAASGLSAVRRRPQLVILSSDTCAYEFIYILGIGVCSLIHIYGLGVCMWGLNFSLLLGCGAPRGDSAASLTDAANVRVVTLDVA